MAALLFNINMAVNRMCTEIERNAISSAVSVFQRNQNSRLGSRSQTVFFALRSWTGRWPSWWGSTAKHRGDDEEH